MRKSLSARVVAPRGHGILVACALALLLAPAGVAHAQESGESSSAMRQAKESVDAPGRARESDEALRQAKSAPVPRPADDEDVDEADEGEPARVRANDPAAVMRTARLVYVRSLSAFVNAREVEDSLRKRKEFRAWGMVITRNEAEADVIIEITRKSLSRRFTFTVVEPRTWAVVTSGKTRSVLFGKKIPNKIAEKFANRFRAVRPYPPAAKP